MSKGTPTVHPLTIPLLAGLAAAVLAAVYWLFGIGKGALDFALSVALFYGGAVVITLSVAGVVWLGIKLFRWR